MKQVFKVLTVAAFAMLIVFTMTAASCFGGGGECGEVVDNETTSSKQSETASTKTESSTGFGPRTESFIKIFSSGIYRMKAEIVGAGQSAGEYEIYGNSHG